MTMSKVEEHFVANKDRLRVREEAANGSWIAINRGPMTVHAYRLLKDWEAAEDAVQEAYLRALKFEQTYQTDMDFDNWFFIILMNVARSAMRNEGLAPEMVEADDSLLNSDDFIEPEMEPFHYLNEREHWERLEDLCTRLRHRDSSVLNLYYRFGHSRSEISKMLDIKESTVHRILHVNRKRITGE